MSSLREFWRQQQEWSEATFGSSQERGPIGPLRHLRKEVDETLSDPTDLEEYADLVFLVFDSCRRAGFSYDQLVEKCWWKLAKNRARTWPKAAADQPAEHDRSAEVTPDGPSTPAYAVTRSHLERAIAGHESLFLSEPVRFVRALLSAIQRGESIVVTEDPQ